MKNIFRRFIGHPKLAYSAVTCAAVFLVLFLLLILMSVEQRSVGLFEFVLCACSVFFMWLACITLILDARNARQAQHRVLTKIHSELHAGISQVLDDLSTAQEKHAEEYTRQAYNTLLGIQKLRIELLDKKDDGKTHD